LYTLFIVDLASKLYYKLKTVVSAHRENEPEQAMRSIVVIGLGGFIGSILRYLISGWVQKLSSNPWFTYGTVGVNLIGCLLIGLLGGWSENQEVFSPSTRLFLFLGILGSFTTFSTFGYETLSLLRDQRVGAAMGNIGLQVIVGLMAVWLGYALSK
jgi:CrcB protein